MAQLRVLPLLRATPVLVMVLVLVLEAVLSAPVTGDAEGDVKTNQAACMLRKFLKEVLGVLVSQMDLSIEFVRTGKMF